MFTLKTHLFLPLSISLALGSASFAETVQGDKDTTATKHTDRSAADRALSQDVETALRADPKLTTATNLSVQADDAVSLAGDRRDHRGDSGIHLAGITALALLYIIAVCAILTGRRMVIGIGRHRVGGIRYSGEAA